MSHQDQEGRRVRINADSLREALQWLLSTADCSAILLRHDCTWTALQLAAAALIWAWSDESTLIERFQSARRITFELFPSQQQFAGSYQAFMKLLGRWTPSFVLVLQDCLRRRMRQALVSYWLVHDFAMFGVDGSRIDLPRTVSNEKAYSASKKHARKQRKKGGGRKKSPARARKAQGPQMWVTTMWHAGTGLPWDWRIGPTDSSERAHMLEMLAGLPDNALLTGDAGFVGYEYARAVIGSGRHLLIRVGSNVRLLRKLGFARESDGTVYLWPDRAGAKGLPPVVLRLVVAHNGEHPVYMVTSVLSSRRLSDRQVIELYRRRWGIELFYRHLKQTFERRKLRSTSAENARVELDWSLLGLWGLALYAQVELQRQDIPISRLSMAGALRAFRRMLRDYRHPAERGKTLHCLLHRALIDTYARQNKASRDYPRQKVEPPTGPPRIVNATPKQSMTRLIAGFCSSLTF